MLFHDASVHAAPGSTPRRETRVPRSFTQVSHIVQDDHPERSTHVVSPRLVSRGPPRERAQARHGPHGQLFSIAMSGCRPSGTTRVRSETVEAASGPAAAFWPRETRDRSRRAGRGKRRCVRPSTFDVPDQSSGRRQAQADWSQPANRRPPGHRRLVVTLRSVPRVAQMRQSRDAERGAPARQPRSEIRDHGPSEQAAHAPYVVGSSTSRRPIGEVGEPVEALVEPPRHTHRRKIAARDATALLM